MNKTIYLFLSVVLLFAGVTFIGFSFYSVETSDGQKAVIKDTVIIQKPGKISFPDSLIATFYFPFGNFCLTPKQNQILLSRIHTLNHDKQYLFFLDGYADSAGISTSNNSLLATHRSFSLYESLINQGISKDMIFIRSFGASTHRKVNISVTEVPNL